MGLSNEVASTKTVNFILLNTHEIQISDRILSVFFNCKMNTTFEFVYRLSRVQQEICMKKNCNQDQIILLA